MNAAIEVRDEVMQEVWRSRIEPLGNELRALVDAVLAGRDAIGVLPEGRERALCYQLPGLFLPRLTIVVTPRPEDSENHVPYLGRDDVPARVYVTPAQFVTTSTIAMLRRNGVSRVVVDRAERLPRSAYARIAAGAWRLERPPILALAESVTEDEIRNLAMRLGLRAALIVRAETAG